jgi:hypothetical protein
MIPASVERRARWVLDTLGGRELGFGDDLPYVERAWESVDAGVKPDGDPLAEGFYHLARVEERGHAAADVHGRFPASASCLDPLDPPLERLRRQLRLEPPRWGGARFAVCLTHDVDTPWRWTRAGIRRGAGRLREALRSGRSDRALLEARALAGIPLHRVRGTDPNWCFDRLLGFARSHGSRHAFYLMAGHQVALDGVGADAYARLRPQLVETLLAAGAEVGLHGSYLSADDPAILREEHLALTALAGPLAGHRYHYLRVDPHRNLRTLAELGLRYDTSLGFADAPGFRAGIAQPFRPWDFETEQPLPLVEIPLAAMDTTFADSRYLGLSAAEAEPRLLAFLRNAAELGGGFSVLWHNDRFDPPTSGGWDRLFFRFVEAVRAHGGVCLAPADLAEEAAAWLG